jgi:hypothetical protein
LSAALIEGCTEKRQTDPTVPAIAEHKGKTKNPEDDGGDGKISQVFDSDVNVVLAAGQTCFQRQEPGLHQKYQHGANQYPEGIESGGFHCQGSLNGLLLKCKLFIIIARVKTSE